MGGLRRRLSLGMVGNGLNAMGAVYAHENMKEDRMIDWKEKFKEERKWRHKYGSTCRDFIVDDEMVCEICAGSGYKLYGDTSTWRDGIGGQMLTLDVCNVCWGSGHKEKPWPSHRK